MSELIWNGLDAGAEYVAVSGAEYVAVSLGRNQLDGLETIQVQDSGSGINHTDIQTLFGNLGESWKKNKVRFKGRALHGKKGQGRFKAFSLGTRVEWNSVYEVNNRRMRFKIIGLADALTDLQFSDPVLANGHPCGTDVLITGVEQKKYGALLKDSAIEELAKLFCGISQSVP